MFILNNGFHNKVISVHRMGELWKHQDEKMDIEKEKESGINKKKNRNVYFCVAHSRHFSTSTQRGIKKLRNI